MKKLIAVLTLFLAFAFSANAQEGKKMKAEDAAKIEAAELAQAVGLTPTQQEDFTRLFLMRHNTMNDPNVSDVKKKEFGRVVDGKIRATLTAEQMKTLENNPDLMNKLIGSAPTNGAAAAPKR